MLAVAPTQWHRCRVVTVDEESRLVHLEFLDGEQERKRRVPMKFVRATASGAQESRDTELAALKATWSQPIACDAEVTRLQEARASQLKPPLWNHRHHLALEAEGRESQRKSLDFTEQKGEAKQINSRCPWSSTRQSTSREERENLAVHEDPSCNSDPISQRVTTVLMSYDRAYAQVREAIRTGAKRYATAVLYRERFHAFDELSEALVALVMRSVEAVEAIWGWKQKGSEADSRAFVWKGADFILTLVHSLDFLAGYPQLVEWYGEEFPLELNPFMLSAALLDKAEERGLRIQPHPAAGRDHQPNRLRAARDMEKEEEAASSPTWWPEARFPSELLPRIQQAEEVRPDCSAEETRATGLGWLALLGSAS
ncbi:hypothetical protein BBJ28_00008305 [Nothophytophthora sp. Chile5]|nr:hypothetical protein BBJ28_00008305 [Nothophytophthora sp. Chile5]